MTFRMGAFGPWAVAELGGCSARRDLILKPKQYLEVHGT